MRKRRTEKSSTSANATQFNNVEKYLAMLQISVRRVNNV